METLPSRRRFLRGAAGAVGMGAVGVFAAKARFAGASEKVAASTVTIPVKYSDGQIEVPDAEAHVGDPVVWEAQDGVQRIIWVKFKDDKGPYPLQPHDRRVHYNPLYHKHLGTEVRDDDSLKDTHHKYRIKIKPIGKAAQVSVDPDLFIVP